MKNSMYKIQTAVRDTLKGEKNANFDPMMYLQIKQIFMLRYRAYAFFFVFVFFLVFYTKQI